MREVQHGSRVPGSVDGNRPVAFEMNQMPWIGILAVFNFLANMNAAISIYKQGSRKDVRVGTAGEAEA